MSQPPTSAPTPVPSSPPAPSESFMSDLDGTAPSILETSFGSLGDPSYDIAKVDGGALNLVSWKLDVNARTEDGVEKRGFNAISTVLNHPTKKANPLRSTRKPLPPLSFAPPAIPKPPPASHYDGYLQTITPLYDNFVSLSQLQSLNASSSSSDELPSLETIPPMFFEKDFSLSNPSTWAELIAPSGSASSASVSSLALDSSGNEGLQDTLSSHLDLLERHLVVEISKRTNSFFGALTNLQELNTESSTCLNRIDELKGSLKDINEKQSKKGLAVINKQNELHTLKITQRNLEHLKELDELSVVLKRLVGEGDWSNALSYLEEIVKWYNKYNTSLIPTVPDGGEPSPSSNLPLSTLPALSPLPTTLDSYLDAISIQLEAALSSFLGTTLSNESAGFDPAAFASTAEPILVGLVRCGKVELVDNVWRDSVTVCIREGSRNVTQSLQSMDHSSFLLLTTQMYASLTSRIRLSQSVGEEVERILKSIIQLPKVSISDSAPSSPTSEPPALPNLQEAITSGCELAHTRASKILAVRAEQHAALGLEEFVEIFRENWEFILATEKIAGKMIVGLRGVTTSQARSFLIRYHSVRLTKSAKLVEEEQWTQIDVPSNVQHVIDLLIQAAVSDPPECTIPPPPSTSIQSSEKENGDASTGAGMKKQVDIEDKSYFLVKATSESLILLGDYLKIVVNLELVVTDVMSRIIEFLKSFNSRTCQVVLGAGAMRSAGLKNITAKHLALASQSLSIIISLIPYIREFVRRHLSPKQAVMLTEFDKLKRDYQEHQNEIHAKLVAIMSDRLAVHVGSLREIDWEATAARDAPRPYAEMLVKETATLHKVLSKYLAASTVDSVMSEVISAIVHRLSEEYSKIEFKSEEAKKRMSQDVALLIIKLTPLSESGTEVSKLDTLVKEKPTPRKPIGQAMSGFLRRNGSQRSDIGSPVDPVSANTEAGDGVDVAEDEDGDGDGAGLAEDTKGIRELSDQTEKKEKIEDAKEPEVVLPPAKTEAASEIGVEEESKTIEANPPIPDKEAGPQPSKEDDALPPPEIPQEESPVPPSKEAELPPSTSPPPPPEKAEQ
uniref:Vacuolar protein sorting-associated protein 54 n=1 Tax=Kwoniella dejecticola CBS 10117 TaxID=1296121 RepID=A0A1A6AA59_9TREE|nr:uncharacterized protein I303_02963 [Kwoniella dejecticola CBS 10117]OBR86942.1 hypothetical protein I303_02963 [Kwoniella dejecticola CBS 10117]